MKTSKKSYLAALPPDISRQIDEQLANLVKGRELLKAFGFWLAKTMTKYRDIVYAIQEKDPSIPEAFLWELVRVGEEKLMFELFYSERPADKHLAKFPFSEQVAHYGKRQRIVRKEGNEFVERTIPWIEITTKDCKVLFGANHIRNVDEQLAFLKGKIVVLKVAPQKARPWDIDDNEGSITIGGVKFFASDWDAVDKEFRARMMTYLERNMKTQQIRKR